MVTACWSQDREAVHFFNRGDVLPAWSTAHKLVLPQGEPCIANRLSLIHSSRLRRRGRRTAHDRGQCTTRRKVGQLRASQSPVPHAHACLLLHSVDPASSLAARLVGFCMGCAIRHARRRVPRRHMADVLQHFLTPVTGKRIIRKTAE